MGKSSDSYGHAPGTRIFAAHMSRLTTKKLEWLHAHWCSLVPAKVTIAAVIRKLVEDSIDAHLPQSVLEKLQKEEENEVQLLKTKKRKNHGESTQTQSAAG